MNVLYKMLYRLSAPVRWVCFISAAVLLVFPTTLLIAVLLGPEEAQSSWDAWTNTWAKRTK